MHELSVKPRTINEIIAGTLTPSKKLELARLSETYTVRSRWGGGHGVVHALATSMGMLPWPTREVQIGPERAFGPPVEALTPPRRLTITVHRIPARDHMMYGPDDGYENCIASGLVDPDIDKFLDGGYECYLLPGSYIEYGLPFQLLISDFRFGLGQCGRSNFRDWKFEAFDGEEWRELFHSRGTLPEKNGAFFDDGVSTVTFPVSRRDAFASSRFRLRLAGKWSGEQSDAQHMHVRGLEVFGTILPPWRL